MKQHHDQSTPAAPLTSSIQPASVAPKRGRPTIQTEQVIARICAYIREEGISDSAAGCFAGVSSTTLGRWKQEDEDFELALGRARGEFEINCVRVIHNAMNKNGTPNWRANAWLLQNSSADGYRPSRKSRRSNSQSSGACRDTIEETDDGRIVLTPEEFEDLIQYRIQKAFEAALPPGASSAHLPEIPNTGILPEIHRESHPSLDVPEPASPSRPLPLGVNPLPSSTDRVVPEIPSAQPTRPEPGQAISGAILPEIPANDAPSVPLAKLSRRERRFQERQIAKARKAAASAAATI
jgi:hypothetical protein